MINKIYTNGDEMFKQLKSEVQVITKTKGEKPEGIFSPNYLKSTVIALLISAFSQYTGIDAISTYSNRIITEINLS